VKTLTAQTPAGETWRVRVVWQPRWAALFRRFGAWRRKRKGEGTSGSSGDSPDVSGCANFDGELGAIIFGIMLLLIGVVVFWFLVLPLLLLAVDIIVVMVLLLLAIPARVLFRRPWTVEAAYDDGQVEKVFSADVVGWRRALETRDDIAAKLTQGFPAPVVGTLSTRPSGPPS
jgi:hypothetical protein